MALIISAITLPQFAVDLFSRDFSAATGVGALSFEVVTSFRRRLLANIPREVARQPMLVYAVRNQSRPGEDLGFDRLKIDTPKMAEAVGNISITRPMAGYPRFLQADEIGLMKILNQHIEVSDNAFVVGFPMIEEHATELKLVLTGSASLAYLYRQALNFAARKP